MSTDQNNFHEAVNRIFHKDDRYDKGAYYFLRKALDYSVKEGIGQRKDNHISAQELLEGIRKFGLDQFGPMTLTLFEYWGVTHCEDFGEIVFNLVEAGIFGRRDEDSKEDFKGGYDFEKAFLYPFLSKKKCQAMERKLAKTEEELNDPDDAKASG